MSDPMVSAHADLTGSFVERETFEATASVEAVAAN
jgi:hypothetical protein